MENNIGILEKKITNLREFISREEGKKEKILEQLTESQEKIEELNEEIILLEKVNILFQKTSEFAREQAKSQIQNLVTKCLQYIFDSDMEFVIEIEEQRGKANAEFYIINEVNGMIIKTRPLLSRGGGVVDIISLALRIAFLEIHQPKIQGPLILDEPAKHVSEDFIFNVGDFLRQTSEMFNRQIIMVTHNQHLASIGNKSYSVHLKSTISKVEIMEV